LDQHKGKPRPQLEFDRAVLCVIKPPISSGEMFRSVAIKDLPNTDETHHIRDGIQSTIGNKLPRDMRIKPFRHEDCTCVVFARVQKGTSRKAVSEELMKLRCCFNIWYDHFVEKMRGGELPEGSERKTVLAYEALVDEFDSKITVLCELQTHKEYELNNFRLKFRDKKIETLADYVRSKY
jgi:hypothetical protein